MWHLMYNRAAMDQLDVLEVWISVIHTLYIYIYIYIYICKITYIDVGIWI